MPALSPLNALSRRVHAAPRRRGISGALQRVAIVVLPRPRLPVPLLGAGPPATLAARDRARRALLEARREMSGVIGNGLSVSENMTTVPAVIPDLERLQGFLEESERGRAALREEVSGLRGMLQQVSIQLDLLQKTVEAIPRSALEVDTPPGAGGDEPPAADEQEDASAPEAPVEGVALEDAADPVQPPEAGAPDITELRERVLRALRERVFAAGTVGTRIEISPTLAEAEAASVLARMNEEALVELAEEGPPSEEATSLRVTLRAPLRWEQFSSLLEAALGRPLPPGSVGWSLGVVRVSAPADPAEPAGQTAG